MCCSLSLLLNWIWVIKRKCICELAHEFLNNLSLIIWRYYRSATTHFVLCPVFVVFSKHQFRRFNVCNMNNNTKNNILMLENIWQISFLSEFPDIKMLFFGLSFILYVLHLSARNGFLTYTNPCNFVQFIVIC